MKTRHIFRGIAVAAALALAAPALAQQGTVVTTSGERVSGHIRDMDRNGYTVRVGSGERRIMTSDIAMVDFGGGRNPTSDELNRIRQGRQLVLLEDGTALVGSISNYERTMPGALADLPDSHAFRVQFQTEGGGERSFLSSDVARIYFKDPGGDTGGGGSEGLQPGSAGTARVVVPANRDWTSTGITVRRGQTLRFDASGRIQLSGGSDDAAEPSGSVSGRYAPSAPLPRSLAGALIGRIGTGQPFAIGGETTVQMPATGQLFLRVNDDGLQDNSGEFTVVIDRQVNRRH